MTDLHGEIKRSRLSCSAGWTNLDLEKEAAKWLYGVRISGCVAVGFTSSYLSMTSASPLDYWAVVEFKAPDGWDK